jgi:hypothetical protein
MPCTSLYRLYHLKIIDRAQPPRHSKSWRRCYSVQESAKWEKLVTKDDPRIAWSCYLWTRSSLRWSSGQIWLELAKAGWLLRPSHPPNLRATSRRISVHQGCLWVRDVKDQWATTRLRTVLGQTLRLAGQRNWTRFRCWNTEECKSAQHDRCLLLKRTVCSLASRQQPG